jgi:hypothetical protein
MSKIQTFLALTVGVVVLTWAATLFTPVDGTAATNTPATADRLVMHEWGTFTTFSGSDGIFLEFRPLADEVNDLPAFVVNRASGSLASRLSKSRIRGRVRMETPVTYFYTDRIREVNVRVDFPDGLLTEFYPPVRQMLPAFDEEQAFMEGEAIGNSSLDWGRVTLLPTSQLVPNLEDSTLREQISQRLAESVVPSALGDTHYTQARATDSALVHFQSEADPAGLATGHFEKFLFYRGVGRFELPVKATFDQEGRPSFQNDGSLPINAAEIGTTLANQAVAFGAAELVNVDQLDMMVQAMLVRQGLYEKEASAMVQTWKQSWFAEQGTRVLYIVPEQTTDELLPLTITPTPAESLRVLVGRMEVMSPAQEQQLIDAVATSSLARQKYLEANEGSETLEPFEIAAEIRHIGRMLEPALVRVSKIAKEASVRQEAEQLLAQLRAP